jgi:hypothetical protein
MHILNSRVSLCSIRILNCGYELRGAWNPFYIDLSDSAEVAKNLFEMTNSNGYSLDDFEDLEDSDEGSSLELEADAEDLGII